MADRYELNASIDKLRAALVKAERRLHLSQPVRSWDCYQRVIDQIDAMTADTLNAIAEAEMTRPGRKK